MSTRDRARGGPASVPKGPTAHRKDAAAPQGRIEVCMAGLKQRGRKAFIPYICAGDPDLATTADLVVAMAGAGADIIELGIPYSDPLADGPTIQAASGRALASGTTVRGVLDCVARIRQRSDVPLLLFTYLNPLMAYGIGDFARDARKAGADGVLLLDLPPDQDRALLAVIRQTGLTVVHLAAPTTPAPRRALLARASRGFLYYVCRLGVTGERASLPSDLARQVRALRRTGALPVCIGFGISSPGLAAQAAAVSDGVVVGSHLVALIGTHAGNDLVRVVGERARLFAEAIHRVG